MRPLSPSQIRQGQVGAHSQVHFLIKVPNIMKNFSFLLRSLICDLVVAMRQIIVSQGYYPTVFYSSQWKETIQQLK